ncbi:MAG: hypothetical protein ACT4TC_26560 [Myxococcaceae bacterium]
MKPFAMIAALFLASCASNGPDGRTYDNNDLELAVGNAAKMSCTCLFVMEMDDAYCKAWVRASPDVARYSVDKTNKTVESSAFLTWYARARYVDDKRGCLLE